MNESCLEGNVKTQSSWWRFFRLPAEPEVHVSDFLKRPVRLTSGSMVTAPAVNFTFALSANSIEAAGGTLLFANKLRGYAGIRATFCFRVNVSTTPFVGGRLRLTHRPTGNNYASLTEPVSRAYYRQWPGVELDVNVQTSAIMKIPHRHILPYLRLFDGSESEANGEFRLQSYQGPSFLAPSVAPDYEVWFWLEDIELVGIKADTADLAVVVPSSGNMKIASGNGEAAKGGPISGFLNATAKVSDWGATMIPALSPYLTPLSWVSRVGARVASALGFSRPINQDLPREVKHKEWAYNANCTGVSSAYNTGIMHDTQVATAPFAGDDEDAMSFEFLNGQYHYTTNLTLGTQVSGALIARGTLNPMALYTQPDARVLSVFERSALFVSPFPSIWPSPAMGVAQFFNSWRAGFKVRLVFGKTKFHTGRLMFGWDYNPVVLGTTDTNAVPAYASTVYNHRQIIDLREGNEFEVTIPYFAVNPFLGMGTSMGSWYLYVVDPLKYSGQVLSTINIIVEMCLEDGAVFAAPRDTAFVADDFFAGVVIASSGSMPMNKKPVDTLAVTFGEDVSSLKQLAMRPHPRATAVSDGHWFSFVTVRTAGVFQFPTNWGPLDWIRRIYSFEKGSLNDIHIPTSDANFATYSQFTYFPGDVTTNRYISGIPYFAAKNSEMQSFITQRYSPLGGTYINVGASPTTDALSPVSELRYRNLRGAETNIGLTSAADDYAAFVFKGTIPFVPRNLTSYQTY